MLIPVDDGNFELPEDVKTLTNPPRQSGAENLLESAPVAGGSTLILERWKVEAHTYTQEAAAEFGLFGSLFSGKASAVQVGLIHEAKRFTIKETAAKRKVELGVAVRLSVATTDVAAEGGVSLPTLAAKAHLSKADARIGISVLGYGGAFGDLLPAPAKLDVESFGVYMEAFRKIQAQVFGEASIHYLVPTLLGFQADTKSG